MKTVNLSTDGLRGILEDTQGVRSVGEVRIGEKELIESVSFENEALGKLTLRRMTENDASALFDFYFRGLSEESRVFFPPYPLFSPPPASSQELSEKVRGWQKEDDWTVLLLEKGRDVIGMCLLKRFRSEHPTSGLAVREEYKKKGLGVFLQTVINEQARMLNLKKLIITLAQDNAASLRLHEKCGFQKTGRIVPHFIYEKGEKKIDRNDIEMVKELGASVHPFRSLGVKDFAEAFGTTAEEVSSFCGDIIGRLNFGYRACTPQESEEIYADISQRCLGKGFSISGPQRKPDWSRGWGEILREFRASGSDLKALMPKDIRANLPLRYKGDYIIPDSGSFEYDFRLVFWNWLSRKYFADYKNIYEFGCGTGHNLALLAGLFPAKNFFGMDWVAEPQKILELISQKYGWKMKGLQFDFFQPDYGLEIAPESLVFTFAALEQLGDGYAAFLDYLFAKKPMLCVNIECIEEYYDPKSRFDSAALEYHKGRGYLHGFLTRLRELEKEGRVEIISARRTYFGSLYHEAYSYLVWRAL